MWILDFSLRIIDWFIPDAAKAERSELNLAARTADPSLSRLRKTRREMLDIDVPFGQCECGSDNLELISGQQLKIRQMEVV